MPAVQVLYFARAREATGGLTEETFDLDAAGADTEHLKAALVAKHPALSSVLESAVLAVNQEYATEVRRSAPREKVARCLRFLFFFVGFMFSFRLVKDFLILIISPKRHRVTGLLTRLAINTMKHMRVSVRGPVHVGDDVEGEGRGCHHTPHQRRVKTRLEFFSFS